MKLLNEKVIKARFIEKNGFDYEDPSDADALNAMRDHYDFNIVESYENANFYIFEESTADGYSVYVATSNLNSVCVSEDIYYYASDRLSDLAQEVLEAGDTLAIDQDDEICRTAISNMYSDFIVEQENDIEEELIDEGYVREIKNPLSSIGLLDMIHQRLQLTESNEYLFVVPEQLADSSTSDIQLIKFYTQICLDPTAFRKYVRKVLNCQMFLAGNNTIKLTQIPLT